ncbi:MAG: thiamine phosphate synthase [Rhodospirillaceae bacterium]|nr:thiamine phosphate synthase [Rhodospirillaceae bacterium]MBT5239659.1 thiamine phosphate synthase [Rhodospirillaceae bacterium]MBT5565527.1 thiamine phosphate synthase [Rhodospirillaceae bacterium]MBT6089857.1 thiamine phosphate synthase [Rhodospirillaceae bacterium]
MSDSTDCRLYLITPPLLDDPKDFATRLPEIVGAGDVACLQLRLKGVDDDEILRCIDLLLPICVQTDTALILNDRPDLAVKSGCDGVHVGPDDTPYPEARAIMGDDASVGVSCGPSRHLAMRLADDGADYVAFGAFFETTTKQNTDLANIEVLEIWSQTTNVPAVAIGGITPDNCRPLISAGADFLAVSSGVWNHPDGPKSAVRLFSERIAE